MCRIFALFHLAYLYIHIGVDGQKCSFVLHTPLKLNYDRLAYEGDKVGLGVGIRLHKGRWDV